MIGPSQIRDILEKALNTLSDIAENDIPWEENEDKSDYPQKGEWLIVYDWNLQAALRFHKRLAIIFRYLTYLRDNIPQTQQKPRVEKT